MATFTKEHSIIVAGDHKFTYNADGHWHSETELIRLFIGENKVTVDKRKDCRWKLIGSITHNEFHNSMTALTHSSQE